MLVTLSGIVMSVKLVQTENDETGKTLADYDETGENKT